MCLPRVRLHANPFGDRRRAARGGGRDRHRQDQSRSVRHGPRRHAFALRHPRQRLQCGVRLGRLQFRLRRFGRRRSRLVRSWHRHRRLRPRARRLQQHRRSQAYQRLDQHARRRARLPHAGHRVHLRAHRLRCSPRHADGRSLRRARRLRPASAGQLRGFCGTGEVARRRTVQRPGVLRRRRGGSHLPRQHRARRRPWRRDRRDRLQSVPRCSPTSLRRPLGRRAPGGDPRLRGIQRQRHRRNGAWHHPRC